MSEEKQKSNFIADWLLKSCRAVPIRRQPAPHQRDALAKLQAWYDDLSGREDGGILVLPTGAGKTFTAVHFLCNGPLSDGYKVLWVAHTHHLLEQAFEAFNGGAVGQIREPRDSLRIRVVSGTPGHFPPRDIKTSDDVVVATLQTLTNAHREGLPAFQNFLASAKGKLFIVFDEAHHAPAPSYRKLLFDLRQPGAAVLGLTATPTYANEGKKGWLKRLFPQGILAQARTADLIASGVLAKPHFETATTSFTPRFDEQDYQRWVGTYRDVPENIVEELAKNRERNALIAETYAADRAKFGKTLIFADRSYQCEAIVDALAQRGVKAAAIYSHVTTGRSTVDDRRRRTRDDNAKALEQFRQGKLDVLVNIRMLTEGTDLPDAQTVFLTRQTTSTILLTQMVGRALRGPNFGGTADAYIVSFVDDWQHAIRWAEYEALSDDEVDDHEQVARKRPPIQLISMDLIKRLARQMNSGVNVAPAPFSSFVPVGWYRVTYDAVVEQSDEVQSNDRLVMVFDEERAGFQSMIAALLKKCPAALAEEEAHFDAHRAYLADLVARHLGTSKRSPDELAMEAFHVVRHVAQEHGAPEFFTFELREQHDVDVLAHDYVSRDLGPRKIHEALQSEYTRPDRFWRSLFPRFEQLRAYYDSCQARLLTEPGNEVVVTPRRDEAPSFAEPSEEIKEQVRRRDGRCLACGTLKILEVDHVVPVYLGGSGDPDNLQTLCRKCNGRKQSRTIRFRVNQTALRSPPQALEHVDAPADATDRVHWERFLRGAVNFTLKCAAVDEVEIGGRGDGYYHWKVSLMRGNPPSLLEPLLPALLDRVQEIRDGVGKPRLKSLTITAPGEDDVLCVARKTRR